MTQVNIEEDVIELIAGGEFKRVPFPKQSKF